MFFRIYLSLHTFNFFVYLLSPPPFIERIRNLDTLKTVIDEVKKVSDWAKNNPPEVAKLLSPILGIDAAVLEIAEKRREYGVLPLTDEVIRKQQEVADAFYKIFS